MNRVKKSGHWVWTEKAEEHAKKLGLEERRAGERAYLGKRPLGKIAPQAWVDKGYVK